MRSDRSEEQLREEYLRILEESDHNLIMQKLSHQHAIEDWVRNLKPWEVIGHFTWQWECSMDAAMKCFEGFMRKGFPDISYYYALEQNPGRKGYHVHALFSDCLGMQRKGMWEKWFTPYGRCRIEPIKSSSQVSSYCAKYVTKENSWYNVKVLGEGLRKLSPDKTRPESN